MHVDMDAFFAAVEERENPELKGKPVVVGSDPKEGKGRGVVSTCNYEARKHGVRSAMPVSTAYKKCPECVFLPVNYELYAEVSQRIMQILKEHADKLEQVSIDEAYLDVSSQKTYEKAKELAQKIKDEIRQKEQLTCSVGIGPNKLVAKIASDYDKPDGLTVVRPEKVLVFLTPLDVGVLRGVGPKTKIVLNKLGVKTVGDARTLSKKELVSLFGVFGESIYEQARGKATAEIVEECAPKSFGRQVTFAQDTSDKALILETMDGLVKDVWKQLRAEKFLFRTVTVKTRYEDFSTHTKSKTFIEPTDSFEAFRTLAVRLLKEFLKDERKIRLVGISAHNLKLKKY